MAGWRSKREGVWWGERTKGGLLVWGKGGCNINSIRALSLCLKLPCGGYAGAYSMYVCRANARHYMLHSRYVCVYACMYSMYMVSC
jgi:hypothetical protein